MKTVFLFIILMLSVDIFSGDFIIVKIQSQNSDLTESLVSEVETTTDNFLKTQNYEILSIDNSSNGNCNSENCILISAKKLDVNNVIVINVNKVSNKFEFVFNLFDLKRNKKYSIRSVYNEENKNNNTLTEFLHSELKELLGYRIKEQKKYKVKLPGNQKKSEQKLNNYKPYKQEGIREKRNFGINAALGGSPVIGVTLDTFVMNGYLNLELSLLAGYMPLVLGVKFYFTPENNFSLYAGGHFLLPVDDSIGAVYFPLGLEYMNDNGFTISVEGGLLNLKLNLFGSHDNIWDKVLWGGIKIGYHF